MAKRGVRDRREHAMTESAVHSTAQRATILWRPPRRLGAVQNRFIAARALVGGDTLCLGRLGGTVDTDVGPDDTYCAVLAVNSVNFALRSEEEQEGIIASFSAWLNALSFSIQILVRVLPLSLDPYLERPLRSLRALQAAQAVQSATNAADAADIANVSGAEMAPAAPGSDATTGKGRPSRSNGSAADSNSSSRDRTRQAWITLIADHVEFVRDLARQRRLLDRHFYVVIPADPDERHTSGSGLVARLASLRAPLTTRMARKGVGGDGEHTGLVGASARAWQRQSVARHQLDLRVTEVSRQLGRMGLSARRVRGRDLLQLYASCLTPQHASRHPIPQEVLAGAGLPTTASRRRGAQIGGADQLPTAETEHDRVAATPANLARVTAPANTRFVMPHVQWRWPVRFDRRTRQKEALPVGQLLLGLGDLLAPESAELARDWVRLGDEYARVLAITGYPRHVYPGWLSRLIDTDVPLEVVLHVHPRDARSVLLRLRKRLVEFQSSRVLDQKAGKLPDTEREVASRDIEQLQEELQRGDTRVFDLALYLLVRGGSLELLDQRAEQVQMALDNLLLVGRPVPYEQDIALTSCLPEAQDRLRRSRLLDTGSVATAFPFSSSTMSMPEGILYGTVPRNGSLIILDPFSPQLENANAVVFAQSGAGKSYACKVQALRSLASGVAVAIVDPEDEYRRLCQTVGGQYVRLSPSSAQRLNPFDLLVSASPAPPESVASSQGETPSETASATAGTIEDAGADDGAWDPLAEKIQALHTLLDLMLADHGPGLPGSLTQREKGLLDRALYETYRRAGITPDPSTHARAAPLLRDLYAVLHSADFREQDATGLADRLHRWVEGSLARLFSAPTNVRLDSPFVVFNIRDLDAELKPIGLALITDTVWTRMRRERGRLPRLLFIDEAWTLMQFPEGGRFLSSLARRARKYYLGLITITQDVQDFLGSEWGQTVLAQSAIKLLMKQDPSTIEGVARVFHLSQGERQFLLGCNKGEGLLFARGAHVALRVEASPREHVLATTNPRELAALEAQAAAAMAAMAATTTPGDSAPASDRANASTVRNGHRATAPGPAAALDTPDGALDISPVASKEEPV